MTRMLNHPRFGMLTYTPPDGWENRNFRFGGGDIQLLVQAGSAGPEDGHAIRFTEFEARYAPLVPAITAALDAYRGSTDQSGHSYVLSTVYLPDPTRGGDLSVRLWFDDPAEDDMWFGVEIYRWDRIAPFAED